MTMRDSVVLSRFFNDNVNFVAYMCPKCYAECQEIRIVSVNVSFLKQFHRNVFNTIVEEQTFGFTPKEIDYSIKQFEKVEQYLYTNNFFMETVNNVNVDEANAIKSDSIQKATVIDKNNQRIYLRGLKAISNGQKKKWKKYMNADDVESQYFEDSNHAYKDSVEIGNNNVEDMIEITPDEKYILLANNKVKNNTKMFAFQQNKFIANFLITNFEMNYLQKRNQENTCKLPASWSPPPSPHNLIEGRLYFDPWALLVATIFLNRTSCVIARPYVFWFLSENPDPLTVLDRFPSDLKKYFVNLGLSETRAVQVYRMSYDFLFKPWKNVSQLYGVGDYGECAYRMFCLGDFTVEPKDRFLKIYKAWYYKSLNKKE